MNNVLNKNEIANKLSETALFRDIPMEKIGIIVRNNAGKIQEFKKGIRLIYEGQPLESVRVILSGLIMVSQLDRNGVESILHILQKGQVLGWELVKESSFKSPYDCTSMSNTVIYNIEPRFFTDKSLLGSETINTLLTNIIGINANESIRQKQKMSILAASSIRKKVAAFFQYEYEQYGDLEFSIPYNRGDLASFLCVNRSALSRELGMMEHDGLIKANGKHIVILNKTDLFDL